MPDDNASDVKPDPEAAARAADSWAAIQAAYRDAEARGRATYAAVEAAHREAAARADDSWAAIAASGER